MISFRFRGEIPASKSIMNRALLVQSYFPALKIQGDSNCEDVRHMKKAVASLIQRKEIPCGEAGTVLRFMGLRASRETGVFRLKGSSRLLQRPQEELVFLLEQLSVQCQLLPDEVIIHSEGWKRPLMPIQVRRNTSSQFATSLLLNSWNLPFELQFEMKSGVSEGYWQMSLNMARNLGLEIEKKGDLWRVPVGQKLAQDQVLVEPDYSSAFALAAAGALAGECRITNATPTSEQPDFRFIEILRQMGASVQQSVSEINVTRTSSIKPVQIDLASSPDLFPVLAVLCAFAKGESHLSGAPHLAAKESNRIEKTAELLRLAGFVASVKPDGLHIVGVGSQAKPNRFRFDPDQDHRMAMAAGLFKLMGWEIQIESPEVVQKSFPEFWKILGVRP